MARPKIDPKYRQNAFIHAASALFFSKGYENTSIRDILDAVGEKSLSPSVFYYYFESKEALYHAVMESYVDQYIVKLQAVLANDRINIEARMAALLTEMINTLIESQPAIHKSDSVQNRLFILDLQERISQRITSLWEEAILQMPWIVPADAKAASRFITGGICSLIYNFIFGSTNEQEDIDSLTHSIIHFSITALRVPEALQEKFIAAYNKL